MSVIGHFSVSTSTLCYMCECANVVTGYQQSPDTRNGTPSLPILTRPMRHGGRAVSRVRLGPIAISRKLLFPFDESRVPAPVQTAISDGSELARYPIDHADDQAKMMVETVDAAQAGIYGTQVAADYAKLRGLWMPQVGGAPVCEMQIWQYAYVFGGMLYAALRQNADATIAVARMMNWLDHIGNRGTCEGNAANAYLRLYFIASVTNYEQIGTVDFGNGHGGIPREEAFCGYQAPGDCPFLIGGYLVVIFKQMVPAGTHSLHRFEASRRVSKVSLVPLARWLPNTSDGHTKQGMLLRLPAAGVAVSTAQRRTCSVLILTGVAPDCWSRPQCGRTACEESQGQIGNLPRQRSGPYNVPVNIIAMVNVDPAGSTGQACENGSQNLPPRRRTSVGLPRHYPHRRRRRPRSRADHVSRGRLTTGAAMSGGFQRAHQQDQGF